jgi:hypothetical protein
MPGPIINLRYLEDGTNGQREAVTSSTTKYQESRQSRAPKADDRASAEIYPHCVGQTGVEDTPAEPLTIRNDAGILFE